MNNPARRIFLLRSATACSALALLQAPALAAAPMVDENDPQAKTLGYRHDTALVDAKKYPAHAASQQCANCQLFQGKPADAAGGCPLFAGKQVAGKGWCSAWSKKAG